MQRYANHVWAVYAFAERKPNCAAAVPLKAAQLSDYECAYSCFEVYRRCKEQEPLKIAACYSAAQSEHPILPQCSVPLGEYYAAQ